MQLDSAYESAIRQGDYLSAIAYARRAVCDDPSRAANQAALGLALLQLGQYEEAEQALCLAVAADHSIALAHNGLGTLALQQHRYNDAEAFFIHAIEADPHDSAALCNLAMLLKDMGRGDEAAALIGPALEMLPQNVGVQWTGALMSNYAAGLAPEQIADRHRAFGQAMSKASGVSTWIAPQRTSDTEALRIGFLSPDMRRHSVSFFLLPLLQAIDRKRFHISCYSLCHQSDEVTSRYKSTADHWRDVSAMTDGQIVKEIRDDRIDLLIDCAGLFNGARPAVLASRAAPVQVTWLGYPNTTGLSQMDYRLVDAVTDPFGADQFAVEKLVHIHSCFVCYQPIDEFPPSVFEHDMSTPIRFGCFNALAKYNDALLDTWAELLSEVPKSKLFLKSKALSSSEVRDWTCDAFTSRGVDACRLELAGYVKSQTEHRAMYNRVDLALDTFPYCGTTTTCESLVMGVPVVTLRGQSHPGRVGASLLQAAGCEKWIAESTSEYVQIAKSLVQDRERLADLHRALSDEVQSSLLCNTNKFARRFEAALCAITDQADLYAC